MENAQKPSQNHLKPSQNHLKPSQAVSTHLRFLPGGTWDFLQATKVLRGIKQCVLHPNGSQKHEDTPKPSHNHLKTISTVSRAVTFISGGTAIATKVVRDIKQCVLHPQMI